MTELQTPKRATSRGLKWAFGISLALNLVFIGVFAGAALRFAGGEHGERKAGPRGQSYGAPFVRALPREDRRKLHRALRADNDGLPSRAERRVLQQQLIDVMRAATFDPTRVEALFETQNDAARQVLGKAQNAWLDIVREMSDAERAGVADRLEERLNRRGRKGSKRP